MGVDLFSESGEVSDFGYIGWSMLLELARRYGWQPQGTQLQLAEEDDESVEWNGSYESSDGQVVCTADARALGEAILAAVADPKLHLVVLEMDTQQKQGIQSRVSPDLAASFVGVKDFEEYRECLRQFSAFCGKGAFTIE